MNNGDFFSEAGTKYQEHMPLKIVLIKQKKNPQTISTSLWTISFCLAMAALLLHTSSWLCSAIRSVYESRDTLAWVRWEWEGSLRASTQAPSHCGLLSLGASVFLAHQLLDHYNPNKAGARLWNFPEPCVIWALGAGQPSKPAKYSTLPARTES